MSRSWYLAMAAVIAVGAATPATVDAQSSSSRARQQAIERARQQQRDREQAKRQEERERMRRIEREANKRGIVLRRNDRDDDRVRRDRDRYERDRYERNRRDRYDDIYRRSTYDRRGPAFCRSGEGHPRYGRAWCRQKGYGLGYEPWRSIWGDIRFQNRRYDNRLMNRSLLQSILGLAVLNQFDSYGRSYYGNGALAGRWMDNRMGILQLYMGSVPIARLIDTDFDGRVDMVSLIR